MAALDPDVAGAVAAGVAHLVGEHRAARLLAEVDAEVAVQRETAHFRVDVDLQHVAAAPGRRYTMPCGSRDVRTHGMAHTHADWYLLNDNDSC